MIITRTPLRISIGGGGTDLPSYYSEHGGFVISAAISKHVFIALNRKWQSGCVVKYASFETVEHVNEIRHPIFREALLRHGVGDSLELASFADVPAGTGLGSSGSFTVGLLHAIRAHRGISISPALLAKEACEIEIETLGQAVGKQDQYIAAFGGLQCMEFHADGSVKVEPLALSHRTRMQLQDRLLMFFTGFARNAAQVLTDQKTRSLQGDRSMLDNLHFTKQLGLSARDMLEQGKTHCYAELLREHWEHKRARSPGTSNDRINHLHQVGMENGALGGKLVGAGGGGFLLFFAEEPARLRRAMAAEGLEELKFEFDLEGSVNVTEEQVACSV